MNLQFRGAENLVLLNIYIFFLSNYASFLYYNDNYKLDICTCIKDSLSNRCLNRGRRLLKIVMRSTTAPFCLAAGSVPEYKEKTTSPEFIHQKKSNQQAQGPSENKS